MPPPATCARSACASPPSAGAPRSGWSRATCRPRRSPRRPRSDGAKAIITPFLRVHTGSCRSRRVTAPSTVPRPARSARRGQAWRSGSSPTRSMPAPEPGISDSRGFRRPAGRHGRPLRPRRAAPTRAARWPRSSTTRRPASAGIRFVTANGGPVAKAQAIDALVAARREGHRRRHQLYRRALLPGRRHRAGRRPRQGRRRRLLRRRPATTRATRGRARSRRRRIEMRGLRPGGRRSTRCSRSARCPRTSSWTSCCSGPSRGAARPRTLRSTSTTSPAARRRWSTSSTRATSLTGLPRGGRAGDRGQRRADLGIAIRRVAGTGNPVPEVHRATQRGRRGDRAPRRSAARSARTPPLRAAL